MRRIIVRNWNRVAVRWLGGSALAVFLVLSPTVAIITLVTLFGAYTVVDELRALTAAARDSAPS